MSDTTFLRQTRKWLTGLTVALALPLMAGCETAPATGEQIFTGGMTQEREREVGREMHQEAKDQFGGVYDDPELNQYVSSIGDLLARTSEMPDLDFTFTVIDSPQVNAFALPGGYVYVTRGLVALANNEAELASVIGHEIGHVTARHAAARQGSSVLAGAAQLGLAVLLGGEAAQAAAPVSAAMVQSYSRDQEFEADTLGIRYLARAGYDTRASSAFLNSLLQNSRLQAEMAGRGGSSDEFDIMQSHPRTADRVQQAANRAGVSPPEDPMRERDLYLSKIDGMLYGDSPSEGFIRGQRFSHPQMRITFTVPEGFHLRNSSDKVVASGPNGAGIIFDGDRRQVGGSMQDYLTRQWAQGIRLEQVESLDINGMEAATAVTRANTNQGPRDLRLVAIRESGNQIYRFMFVTPPQATSQLSQGLRETTYSFRRLSQNEANSLRPYRLRIHQVQQGESVAAIARRMPFDQYREARFRVLNGLGPNDRLRAGDRVKTVVEE
ncbi:M48 family metalloprotease [Fodinicurvata fenggangensis]|uniref:M48 family metalloprotease n=1 Tax=Fodinicurvata fenggangensis TaxID=1121830 RepID=UPI00068BE60C|nr:M48 family metalloprotease [Fodinicurvata fenggangensis]